MRIGMTGVTGFVGSVMAAYFLENGLEVLAFSRNDSDGARTKKAVLDAQIGCSLNLDISNLKVQSINFSHPENLNIADLESCDVFWHVAAHMSYSSRKYLASFEQNVTNTVALYSVLAKRAKKMQGFFYVSTAYTFGFGDHKTIEEVIHKAPHVDNSYQALKWTAEVALREEARKEKLSLWIFRPSIVVGHSQTGYRGRSEFGLYGFAKAAAIGFHKNYARVCFDIQKEARLNLLPVDVLCQWAVLLTLKASFLNKFDIFHGVARHALTVSDVTGAMSKLLHMDVRTGKPKSYFDNLIQKHTSLNKAFAQRSFDFSYANLQAALGEGYKPFDMSQEIIEKVLSRYFLECFSSMEDSALEVKRGKERIRKRLVSRVKSAGYYAPKDFNAALSKLASLQDSRHFLKEGFYKKVYSLLAKKG